MKKISLILIILLSYNVKARIRNTIVPFSIDYGVSDTISSVLSVFDEFGDETKLVCEFEFKAKEEKSSSLHHNNRKKKRKHQNNDADDILDRIFGTCVRKTVEYWSYEVCFGNKAVQFHGAHSIDLGHYSQTTKNHNQIYTRGSGCEALPHESFPPRTSTIVFLCTPQIEKFEIISVEEVSVCNYEFRISSSVFCDSEFELLQSESSHLRTDTQQFWKMSFADLDYPKDQVLCTVFEVSNGIDIVEESKVEFDKFELRLKPMKNVEDLKLFPVKHSVRNLMSDLEIDKGMYELDANNNKKLILMSGQGFEGELSIVSIQAFTTNKD